MAYLNKAMLIGNIGKDPTVTSPNGKKCVRFSLATSKKYRDNNGEQKELTEWHNIAIWGKSAETFEKLNVGKGVKLYVEGEIANRSWTDKNGQKRYMTEINASTFQVLTPRNTQPQGQQGSVFGQEVDNDYQQGMDARADAYADDLPF